MSFSYSSISSLATARMYSSALEWKSLSPRWRMTAVWLSVITSILVFPYCLPTSLTSRSPLSLAIVKDHNRGIKKSAQHRFTGFRHTEVPNIVHFVHLLKLDTNQTFDFPLRQFISIYSAHYHLQPDVIYIHTNVPEHQIEKRIKESSSPYTHAVSRLPRLKFNYHAAPNVTSRNQTVDLLANKSDFVRTSVLVKYGGIYLDDDVYVLRDLKPFRQAGFENVIGLQGGTAICPAVIMATKDNDLMHTYHEIQDIVFDGSWANHAVALLSTLAREFSPYANQVLITHKDTFFPFSWMWNDLRIIYQVNGTQPKKSMENNRPLENITDFIEHFEQRQPKRPKDTWHVDWRLSYTLHGWNHGLENLIAGQKGDDNDVFGSFGSITLEYVLSQNSNFARAVYPAVRHAVDNGWLDAVHFEQDFHKRIVQGRK